MSKQFSGLHNKLLELLEASSDIFLKERLFLMEGGTPEINDLDEATQNQLEIEMTAKALQAVIKESIPAPIPPKQQDLL